MLHDSGPGNGRIDWAAAYAKLERAIDPQLRVDPEQRRRVLEQRTAELATLKQTEQRKATISVVLFELGGDRFAVNAASVAAVKEIGSITPIPGSPQSILGIVNYRGATLTVVDVRPIMQMQIQPLRAGAKLLIVTSGKVQFGLPADAVIALRQLYEGEVSPVTASDDIHRPAITGVTVDSALMLDVERIVSDARLIVDDR